MFCLKDAAASEESVTDQEQAQLSVLLSVAAVSGNSVPRTMSFDGLLGSIPVCILLDSGSTHTFVSESVASSYSDVRQLVNSVHVQVANGQLLTCSHYIPTADLGSGVSV